MRWERVWIALAALSGLISVIAGAFAAHGLADQVARDLVRTGATYEMTHALATLACIALAGSIRRARFAPVLFLSGSVLFSGSLYALALGAPPLVGAITPLGGLLFIAGWASLAWAAFRAE